MHAEEVSQLKTEAAALKHNHNAEKEKLNITHQEAKRLWEKMAAEAESRYQTRRSFDENRYHDLETEHATEKMRLHGSHAGEKAAWEAKWNQDHEQWKM
jgi:hypothetical protein